AWALRQPVPLPWSRLRRLRRRGSPPPENKARQARRLQRDKLPVEPASCPKFRHAAGVRSEKTRIRKSDKKLYNANSVASASSLTSLRSSARCRRRLLSASRIMHRHPRDGRLRSWLKIAALYPNGDRIA